jgi:hypothetical protein
MPRMIGLHHHMSYSPASASQSRLGTGDDKINTPRSANSGNRKSSQIESRSGGSGNNINNSNRHSHKQQQFVLAELAEDTIRALRVHKIRDERPAYHPADVVQVEASTVMPTIVVDSVSKSAGGRQAAARARRKQQQQQQQHRTAADIEGQDHAEMGSAGEPARHEHQYRNEAARDDQRRHFLIHEQQRREHQRNQVVLIMSDTGSLAGANGVPIIGRRLPSKSFDHQRQQAASASEPGQQQQQTAAGAAPVVGRRSHRLLGVSGDPHHQQTEPALLFRVAERNDGQPPLRQSLRHHQLRPLVDMDEATRMDAPIAPMLVGGEPAPLAWLAGGRPATKKKLSSKRSLAGSSSCSSLFEHAGQQQRQAAAAGKIGLAGTSELCLDACCLQPMALTGAMLPPDGRYLGRSGPLSAAAVCTLPCCRLAGDESAMAPTSGSIRSSSSASRQQARLARGRSRERSMPAVYDEHATCQANEPPALVAGHLLGPVAALGAARRSSSMCRSDELGPMPMELTAAELGPRGRLGVRRRLAPPSSSAQLLLTTSGHPHAGLEPRQLQHQQPPPVPCKPMAAAAAYKQSIGRNRELLLRHHQHHLERVHQFEQEQQESAAVTQMYESLAAELKAKLGHPNRAPILLPPKDYDTLSRKQGKLNGIEQRRSTNPQLVGPTASRSVPAPAAAAAPNGGAAGLGRLTKSAAAAAVATRRRQSIGGDQLSCDHDSTQARGAVCPSSSSSTSSGLASSTTSGSSPKMVVGGQGAGSARSSGRSSQELEHGSQYEPHSTNQDELRRMRELAADGSLQRSRSNSSSGLGSISISAGSPDQHARSSPSHSSGSETDMTMAHHQHQEASLLQATLANDEFIVFGSTTAAAAAARRHDDDTPEPTGSTSPQAPLSAAMQDNTATPTRANERDSDRDGEQADAGGTGKRNKGQPPGTAADGHHWNGRVEVPLKINNDRRNGNTYLATKQIIY